MKSITIRSMQSGMSMIETLIALPVMLLLGMGIVHLGLVYQARANLEYAALMAARVGSVTGINIAAMTQEAATRMVPSRIGPANPPITAFQITVLNPTLAMFASCGQLPVNTSDCQAPLARCEMPNFGLQYRVADRSCAGFSIQDANILRIKVTYAFDSKIPFMNTRLFSGDDPGNSANPLHSGTNISAVATVRMQSPARHTVFNHSYFIDL